MIKLLKIETTKARREWVFYLITAGFIVLNVTNGTVNYIQNKEIFQANNVTWLAVWGQSALLWSTIFLPFGLSLYCGMLSSLDNTDRNWQRLISYGIAYQTYLAKLGKAAAYCLFSQLAFYLAVTLISLVLGFSFQGSSLFPLLGWALLGWLGSLTIASLQLFLGLYVASYPVLVGIGTIGAFMGLALSILLPLGNLVFPYSQIILGNHVRELAPFSPAMLIFFLLFNSICLVLPTGLALARLQKFTH